MNGSAGDFDPRRQTVFLFGGGSPHSTCTNVTSALRLRSCGDGAGCDPAARQFGFSAHWETLDYPDSLEAGMSPSPRQGVRGVVFGDEFITFGGRRQGGECLDDVWSLDLTEAAFRPPLRDGQENQGLERSAQRPNYAWRQLACEGRGPSPRVWYAACHAVYGRWFIYGGSTWALDEPSETHSLAIYILELAARRWSSVDPQSGPRDCAVASVLVPLGNCQMLLLGGTFPHRLGNAGLARENLKNWRKWYSRLDMPHVFDLGTQTWTGRTAAVAVPPLQQPERRCTSATEGSRREEYITELLLRSHLSAAFVPGRRSVIVFGGSRYFTGEYFHDILELELPGGNSSGVSSVLGPGRPLASRLSVHGSFECQALPKHFTQQVSRGLVGRYRALDKDSLLPAGRLQELVQLR